MKSHYLIYLLVFLCLMAGTRAEALSKEAQSAIEGMRERLTSHEVTAPAVENTHYTPGRDLAQALARLRQKIHGTDLPVAETIVAKADEKIAAEDYVAGKRLAAALLKIRESQGRTEPLSIAMADMDKVQPAENTVKEETQTAPQVVASQAAPVEEKPVVEQSEPKAEEKKIKNAGKRSSGKKSKKQKKQKKAQPAQSEIVKKAVPAPAQADKTVAVKNDSEKPAESKEKSVSAKGDDKAFNDSIKKYDFKMPENYRIIVR